MAKVLLWIKGYEILEERYKTPLGEIDIIARSGNYIVFVEVKYRPKIVDAMEAVSQSQQERIVSASRFFITKNPKFFNMNMRFDVIIVSGYFYIKHIKNAWMGI